MSLHAPFLVKQYLSNDLESGSYSRIFWYYPLSPEKSAQGGIGIFFEVISGDVADETYEQITKRFWESFSDHFYAEGFEVSLKRAIKMFIQLLRNFDVEEGLDVNIVLFNVLGNEKGYTLKLISFGDSDIFVVRDGQFADMGKMVPVNASLYDLKFLEVELDKGDALMLGNKTLLRNAFEADMFALGSLEELLRTLESFKENLFGSKKVFIVAATEATTFSEESKGKFLIDSIKENAQKVFAQGKLWITSFLPKTKKIEVANPVEDLKETPFIEELVPEDITDNAFPTEEEGLEDIEDKSSFIAPPPVTKIMGEEEEINELTEIEGDIIPAVAKIPGRSVSVDDFVVSEEITPAMVVEKSSYQDIVNEASQSEERTKSSTVVQPITKGRINYVDELRTRHSPWSKFTKSPLFRRTTQQIDSLLSPVGGRLRSLLGASEAGREKVMLSKPSRLEVKKIQPGVVIIIGVVVLVLFIRISSSNKQKNAEKILLQTYQSSVATFMSFYEKNIEVIDKEDTERQLELCAPEAEKVYDTQKSIESKIKIEKNKQEIVTLTDQVKARVSSCETKYDEIYGIVRIKTAELITDFKLALGSDSMITSMSLNQGLLVVTDAGRKAVYQINVETKIVTKIEDPLGLVTEPVAVGTGEGTLFVCDKTNGVLYFTQSASGGKEGFNRMIGTEPASVGECTFIEGFAKNAYFTTVTGTAVYRVKAKGSGYELPELYMKDLVGARSLSIDGSIYLVSTTNGTGDVAKYFGGKLDNFAMPSTVTLGELTVSYTNPSNEKNIFVYDKTANAILSIEKPASDKHPGQGLVEKTYLLNAEVFPDIKGIAVDLNGSNQEVYLYVLSGTSIRRIQL